MTSLLSLPAPLGYWPKLSWPWLATGNRAIRLLHLQTGEQYDLGIDGYPHGWLDATTLFGTRMLVDDNLRHLLRITPPATVKEETEERIGFQQVAASEGHWAAWDTASRIWFDDAVMSENHHGLRQHGPWVAARYQPDDYALRTYCDGVFDRQISKLCEVHDWAILDGIVVYGYPRVMAAYPGGLQRDVTRSPWCEGATSGSGFHLMDFDGEVWLWSAAQIDAEGTWGVIGGVLGSPEVIVVPVEASNLDVQVVGDEFVIAASSATGACQVVSVPVSSPRVLLTVPVPPPATASFTLDTTSGPVPLTVTARLTQTGLTTWRWLLNGTIHQPIDGLSHGFEITTPGPHVIGLRTSPAVDVPAQTVAVLPAVTPPLVGNPCGVQVGFGYPVGAGHLQRFKDRQFKWMRVGIDHRAPNRAILAECIREVVALGLSPLVLLPVTAQTEHGTERLGEWVPDGLDVEYYGPTPDPTSGGQEADNRQEDPAIFAAAVDAVMPYHRAHGHRVWAPALSNPSKRAFAWLTRFVDALQSPDVGISIHRYPDYGMKRGGDGRKGFKSLRDEIETLKRIIVERPWIMSEGDWHTGWMWMWQGDLFKWLRIGRYRLTDAQVVANTVADWKIMRQMGCQILIWYQAGQADERGMGEGLLDSQGRDKPQLGIAEQVMQ